MPRIVPALTDSHIHEVRPGSKPIKLADGGGMYLLVRPDGSRYLRLDYRFAGKRKTLAMGVYPQVSLVEAENDASPQKPYSPKATIPARSRRPSRAEPYRCPAWSARRLRMPSP